MLFFSMRICLIDAYVTRGPIKRNREGETITWHLRSHISMGAGNARGGRGNGNAIIGVYAFVTRYRGCVRVNVRVAANRNEKFLIL